jgi:cobalamin synthase
MGFGFPTGMRLVSAISTGPTPWFWGINGAAGVLAASVAVATSIAFSIDTTLRIGAACYLLVAAPAMLLMSAGARSSHTALRSQHPSQPTDGASKGRARFTKQRCSWFVLILGIAMSITVQVNLDLQTVICQVPSVDIGRRGDEVN